MALSHYFQQDVLKPLAYTIILFKIYGSLCRFNPAICDLQAGTPSLSCRTERNRAKRVASILAKARTMKD